MFCNYTCNVDVESLLVHQEVVNVRVVLTVPVLVGSQHVVILKDLYSVSTCFWPQNSKLEFEASELTLQYIYVSLKFDNDDIPAYIEQLGFSS